MLPFHIKWNRQQLEHKMPHLKTTQQQSSRNPHPEFLNNHFQGVALSQAKSKPLSKGQYLPAKLIKFNNYLPNVFTFLLPLRKMGLALLSFERRHLFTKAEIKSLPCHMYTTTWKPKDDCVWLAYLAQSWLQVTAHSKTSSFKYFLLKQIWVT